MGGDLILSRSALPMVASLSGWLLSIRSSADLQRAKLPTKAEQRALAAELVEAVKPCGVGRAAEMAQLLVGSYPRHAIEEPEIYSRSIVSILAEYPASVASRAVDLVTRKIKFVPTRAEVFDECERLMRELRWMEYVVGRIDAERDRRAQERLEREASEAARLAWREKHGDKSPIDVLRERGLFNSKGIDNDETKNSGPHHAKGGDAGRSGKRRKPERGGRGSGKAEGGGN